MSKRNENNEQETVIDDYLTPKDIQSILKFGRQKTYELINQEDFPKIRIGNSIRIPKTEFNKFMKNYLYKNYTLTK